jgi:serine/threonine protein kinase
MVNDSVPFDADWRTLRSLFEELAELPAADRATRLAALDLAPTLRQQLERLLRADERSIALPTGGSLVFAAASDAAFEPPPPPTMVLAAPARVGRYELRQRLGAGGMGEVHLAHDTELSREVAVKLLSTHLLADPQWLPRFRSEARAAGGLNHPNVITVHDVGEADGVPFLVTEYVAGTTLRQRLVRGRLGADEWRAIAAQVVAAIAAAHEAGIVHRDLKPENVMLRPDGLVKVLDFGLAKRGGALPTFDAVRTGAGVLLGSLRYMSPEQARGDDVDARSDVFGLGALLHEMATGEPVFAGESPLDVLVALLERKVSELHTLRPDLGPQASAMVAAALHKDRTLRPASAVVLRQQFEALRGEAGPSGATGQPPANVDEVPQVRYARSGDVGIAYQVVGQGPVDLVFVMGWISHLEWFWKEPSFAAFLRALAQHARVILFDKRGTGLSDRVPTDRLPTLEQRMDDVRAVLDAVGSERAVLCGISEGGPMCALFAATYPARTAGLVMIGSYARRLTGDGYPWGSTAAQRERFCEEILTAWGGPVGIAERAPSKADDPAFRAWWAAYLRHGASPNAAVALTRMNAAIDVRPVLPTIKVPTLVVHRTGDRCLRIDEGRFLARSIPGARMVELPGDDHLPFVGDQTAIVAAITQFLAELPHGSAGLPALATALHARAPARTDEAAVRRWRQAVLGAALANARTLAFGDDGLAATFDGPERAIRAALELADAAERAGADVAFGVHTGACEIRDWQTTGDAQLGARALAQFAAFGEVLVSIAAHDLVAGAGFRLVPRGEVPVDARSKPLPAFAVARGGASA